MILNSGAGLMLNSKLGHSWLSFQSGPGDNSRSRFRGRPRPHPRLHGWRLWALGNAISVIGLIVVGFVRPPSIAPDNPVLSGARHSAPPDAR